MLTRMTLNWSQKKTSHKWLIAAVVFASVVFLFVGVFFLVNRNVPGILSPLTDSFSSKEEVVEVKLPNPINGILTPESEVKSWNDRYPIGVMIENLNITRPQTGLSRADIVYEALTEGEITRFMAVYLSENSTLGPVRSARLPFLSWILEYNGALAHVGGSSEALENIPVLGVKDMDQSYIGSPTFDRINNRNLSLEHTMFTSTDRLWTKAKEMGNSGVTVFTSWKFKEDNARENRPETQKLTLKYTGNPDYIVSWTYDPQTNTYSRTNGGLPHLDAATQEVIRAKNVIVQFVKTNYQEVSPGKVGRGMETVGVGEARIFRDGVSISGTWQKMSETARTKFLDQAGNEIELNRGKIWVEVNPTDNQIEYN